MYKNNRYLFAMQFAPGEANFLRTHIARESLRLRRSRICIYDPLSHRRRLAKGHYGTLMVSRLSRKTAWSSGRIIIIGEMPIIDSGITSNTSRGNLYAYRENFACTIILI